MRNFPRPEWKPKPSPYTERLPPARIEAAEQAGDRAIALLGSMGLVSAHATHRQPPVWSIPGFVRGRLVRQRWWFVMASGVRGLPQCDEWSLWAVIDAHTGELRWWRFWHKYYQYWM